MVDEKIIYSCLEHIEVALDDFVNETEDAPDMQKCDDKTCSYCTNNASYKLLLAK